MYCIVRDCRNVWYPESSIKFHSFPTNPIKRKAWLATIEVKSKFYNSARICSNHFKPEDYDPERPNHLLNNALPFCYKICECCNKSECINMPSTLQSTSSVVEDLQIMLPPQKDETPVTRPVLNDFKVQANLKTAREVYLVKKNKILQQQVRRQGNKLKDLKSIMNIKKRQVP